MELSADDIRRWAARQESLRSLAGRHGVSHETIRTWLTAKGVTQRPVDRVDPSVRAAQIAARRKAARERKKAG